MLNSKLPCEVGRGIVNPSYGRERPLYSGTLRRCELQETCSGWGPLMCLYEMGRGSAADIYRWLGERLFLLK